MDNSSHFFSNLKLDLSKKNYSFPAFVANAKDPLFKYGGMSFLLTSLNNEEGRKAIELSEKALFNIKPANRICKVDGKIINDPDDYLFIPLLTSDEEEELYKFNFLTFNKRNLKKWSDRIKFLKIVNKFKEQGKWSDSSEFKFLDSLINEFINAT